MSYELVFARPKRKLAKRLVADSYAPMQKSDVADSRFDLIPIEKVLNALKDAFENFEPSVRFPAIAEENASADVEWGCCWFSFTFRGASDELRDRVVKLMKKFKCPVYDPQTSTLHGLSRPPVFSGGTKKKWDLTAKLARLIGESGMKEMEEEEAKRQAADRARHLDWHLPVEKLDAEIIRDCSGGRWQRLGLKSHDCAAMLHNVASRKTSDTGADDGTGFTNPLGELRSAIDDCYLTVAIGFFQAVPPSHRHHDYRIPARMGAAKLVELCHGDWRDGYREWPDSEPMTRAQSRTRLGWIDDYRRGLLMALLVDESKAIRRIVEWPDTDLMVDDGSWDLTAADNDVQIALAFALRGERGTRLKRLVEKIRSSKRKRAMTFWAAVEAIVAGDAKGFARHLREATALYQKSGFSTNGVEAVHIEGSILWHVARRAKLTLPELPQRTQDLILR